MHRTSAHARHLHSYLWPYQQELLRVCASILRSHLGPSRMRDIISLWIRSDQNIKAIYQSEFLKINNVLKVTVGKSIIIVSEFLRDESIKPKFWQLEPSRRADNFGCKNQKKEADKRQLINDLRTIFWHGQLFWLWYIVLLAANIFGGLRRCATAHLNILLDDVLRNSHSH